MLTFILVFALIAGSAVIYLSNKNQRWRKKHINSRWRILAYFLFIFALFGFYSGMSLPVSLFICLMVIMLSHMFIPFLVLMVRDK